MRMLRLFLLLLAAAGVSAQTITYDCATSGTNCNVAMPDPSGATIFVVNSTINVPALCSAGQFVSKVTPRLNVIHPNVGDLTILLLSPTFANVGLIDRPLNQTGSCTGDNILASFDDAAPPFGCSSTPPANGTDPVHPDFLTMTGILPFVQGSQGIGTWQLQLQDNTAPNTGNLNGWSLTFECSPLNVVTIDATDATGSESGDPITFTVTRTGNPALPLFVGLNLTGTATLFTDYTSSTGGSFVQLPSGATTGTITLTPIADGVVEGNETIIATIAPSPAYVVGSPSTASAVLAEPAPIPTLSPWMLVVFAAAIAVIALLRS